MKVSEFAQFFLYASAAGYALLFVWLSAFAMAKDWWRDIYSRIFDVDPHSADVANFCAMGLYKLALTVFFFIPLLLYSLAQ